MKTSFGSLRNTLILLFLTLLNTAYAFGQDGSTDGTSSSVSQSTHTATSTTTDAGWYTSPWVWVVGGAVLVLLLIALLRGNRGGAASDGTTVSRTTVTRTDVSGTDA